jgi:hypothetical protein
MTDQIFMVELRKRKDNTIITLTEDTLTRDSDKILQLLSKECADLRTWFYIIVNKDY